MTVYARNGDFYYDFRKDGARHTKRVGPSRKAAVESQKQAKKALSQPQPPPTVAKAIEDYLALTESHWSKSTHASATCVLGCFARYCEDLPVSEVFRETLEGYRGFRNGSLKASSLRHEFAIIGRFLRHCVARGYLPTNPGVGMPLPRLQAAPDRILTHDEEERLFAAITRPVIRDMVRVLLCTAIRRKEICTLTWRQVDTEGKCLLIPQTKTGRIKRIPLTTEAMRAILQQSGFGDPDRAVFLNMDGNRFAVSSFWTAFRKAANKVGLRDVRIHDLRHTVATRLLRAGCDLSTVGSILGHAAPYTTTLRYTAHVSEARMREALEKINQEG